MMNISKYPPCPSNADAKVLNPTREYKHEVLKVSGAILLFLIVYFCLVLLSVGLAALLSFIGIQIIIIKPMFITLILGAGFIGLGLMVIYFLIKFIFAIKKYDRSGLYEIKEKEHPNLYLFIKQLTKETKTPMPKRIYLSPEVSASVFYDSSFLSMFFPVRKNLLIGLGLVNSVNMSEFKAVIAHEFGHFSQHSMKLGSYVFNVNKIIHNMLYDNDGYGKTLDKWASVSGYFKFFVILTVKIVMGIQWILQKIYDVVNKSNLSLSRQMEHHADTVSAFVTGPNHLVSALLRIKIADVCYEELISKWNNWITDNLKPINLFKDQREIIALYASDLELPLVNGLPVIKTFLTKNKSRLIIKNKWASHPEDEARELYLKSLNIQQTIAVEESPWVLFNSANELQEKITGQLFSKIKYEGDCEVIDSLAFREKYYAEKMRISFNKKYKGYYDNRRLAPLNVDSLTSESNYKDFEELFSEENCEMPRDSERLKSELQILEGLQRNQYDVKTFDFKGKKCGLRDVPVVRDQIKAEESVIEDKINMLDAEILKCALSRSDSANKRVLIDFYKRYYSAAKDAEESILKYHQITDEMSPIYKGGLSFDKARDIANNIKSIEKEIGTQIKNVLLEARQQKTLGSKQLDEIDDYLSISRDYFNGTGFNESELNSLNEELNLYLSLMLEREFQVKKGMLEKQFELLSNNTTHLQITE